MFRGKESSTGSIEFTEFTSCPQSVFQFSLVSFLCEFLWWSLYIGNLISDLFGRVRVQDSPAPTPHIIIVIIIIVINILYNKAHFTKRSNDRFKISLSFSLTFRREEVCHVILLFVLTLRIFLVSKDRHRNIFQCSSPH